MLINCFCLPWDCNYFWAAITAVGTILLFIVGWIQLEELNDTNRQNFLHDLKNDFFSNYEDF